MPSGVLFISLAPGSVCGWRQQVRNETEAALFLNSTQNTKSELRTRQIPRVRVLQPADASDMSSTAAPPAPAADKWDKNMTQEDFMFKDECILLDKDDNVVGHANKKISHVFAPEAPRALLHRAFSVFIFDSQGRLLLQKRAASKITFPNVWTNTCCSHPLYGFTPTEVDAPSNVANGTTMGTKRAAIRKLDHELGIAPSSLDINGFKFLTRLHYWAADVVTHGAASPWGEHEIDYILFYR
jgi:isopentenyl-diphosphate delta-isomerase